MIGVILAAGVGSRLRPMTNRKPKCLVTTAGKPILQYQLDAYRAASIKELIIIVGYEGDAIREYCKHIKDLKITILENIDYELTNNMYSLYLAKKHVLGKPFILNNADLSIDVNIVKSLLEHHSEDAVAVDSSQFNDESMKISINERGFISNISKEIQERDSFACSIDFYKFSSAASTIFFDEITRIVEKENNLKDWTEVALQRLFMAGRLNFMPCDISGQGWVEIDNYEDLALSDRKFSKFDEIIDRIENILFDLDGTVYIGSNVVMGGCQAINKLEQGGKNIYFLSNNSSKTKEDYAMRLKGLGIDASSSQIVLSTDGLVNFLKKAGVEKIHILGTKALKKMAMDEGFQIDSTSPEYVVIGYDTELTYQKLIDACKYINDGVDMLATHRDASCPSEYGPIPDIGAMLEMIHMTTGKEPLRIFGKPDSEMVQPLFDELNLDPQKTLIVGDRLHTDIQMAKNISCFGLLVLSGETTRNQLETSSIQPDFVIDSIAEI